jgi:hypothetical protein
VSLVWGYLCIVISSSKGPSTLAPLSDLLYRLKRRARLLKFAGLAFFHRSQEDVSRVYAFLLTLPSVTSTMSAAVSTWRASLMAQADSLGLLLPPDLAT